MKTKTRKSLFRKRRNILIFIATVIAIVGLLICSILSYNQYIKNQNKTTTNTSGGTQSQNQNDNKVPTQPTGGLPDNTTTTTPSKVPTSADLSVSITSISQSDGIVRANAKTSSDGTCVFLFQPGDNGKPVTRQVEITDNACSVNISQDEFVYLGQWSLSVTYYNGGNKAEASQDVTIH